MPNLFNGDRGTVIREENISSGGLVSVDGLDPKNIFMLTDVRAERNQVVQYIKTLDTSNFGYSWGEGVGAIHVSGVVFFCPSCKVSGEAFGTINDFYSENNVYDNTSPVKVSLGAATFDGYLEQLQLGAQENEFNFGTFYMRFSILPKGKS